MMLRRTLLATAATALAAGAVPRAHADAVSQGAIDLVTRLAQDVIAVLKNKRLDQAARIRALGTLFRASFDVETIGRFVLGRYWRSASEQERGDYLQTFQNYVVAVYAIRFNSYAGEVFKVTHATPDGPTGAFVFSEIGMPGEDPTPVQWRVRRRPGGDKIVDVIVEGVSLLVTQRSEFASVLQSNGGSVAALTGRLREKITQLTARS